MEDYFQSEVGGGKVLLMIEEDTDVANVMVAPLKEKKYSCEVAVDLETALEWLASLNPDLLLLDFHEKEYNGLEFLKLLRERPEAKEVPVLFFSIVPEEFKEPLQQYGPVDYVTEAYDSDHLCEKVESMIG